MTNAEIILQFKENFESIYEAFKARDEYNERNNEDLLKVIAQMEEQILKHREEIKDLQETVSDLVLLTGETESNN